VPTLTVCPFLQKTYCYHQQFRSTWIVFNAMEKESS